MSQILETDYLVVGAGAVGMAFVDTLLDECDSKVIMVDNHHQPGGHWNDAYPFVRLHQPSHFYGVASTQLGSMKIEETGTNKGYFELATGTELQTYFSEVMHKRFLPSGRVNYYPMCEWQSKDTGVSSFINLLSGEEIIVRIKKRLVDTTYFKTSVPSRHKRAYKVAPSVACVSPNKLPSEARNHDYYCIVGAGKTAMDVGIWLLENGARSENICWVCPRHSWLMNREVVQGHENFFFESMICFSEQMEAIAKAGDVDELFREMEACNFLMRIYPEKRPTMFHYAVSSRGEVNKLRQIDNLLEHGRISSVENEGVIFESGASVKMPTSTLYIDCTASAVDFLSSNTKPIFQPGLITPQATQLPNPCFSAAMAAFVETNYPDDEVRNNICKPIPVPDDPRSWLTSQLGHMMNQGTINKDPKLKDWASKCRLDGVSRLTRDVKPYHFKKVALLTKLRSNLKPAMTNLRHLIATSDISATG